MYDNLLSHNLAGNLDLPAGEDAGAQHQVK
jgi:hypothetical protein